MEKKIESQEKEKSFEDANSWEELYEIIDSKGFIVGAHEERKYIDDKPVRIRKEYSAAELKDRIDKVREGNAFFKSITSNEGLRDKVVALMIEEVQDWKELEMVMNLMYGMPEFGSKKKKPGYWIERMEDIRDHDLDPIHMTSKYGLRSKAMELRNKNK